MPTIAPPQILHRLSPMENTFRLHRGLIVACGVYIVACALLLGWLGYPSITTDDVVSWSLIVLSIAASFFIGNALWVIVVLHPKHPVPVLWQRLRAQLSKERLLVALPVLVLIGPFATAFGRVKSLIPVLHPFAWDAAFSDFDIWLHGGSAPWQWLAPWLLNGPSISVISVLYGGVWTFAVFFVLAHASVTIERPARRMQLLYSFFACWALLGTLAATAFSAAGPAYYSHFANPPDLYAPLIQRLTSLDAQGWHTPLKETNLLWQAYQAPGLASTGLGISAMPSLHVSMACLFVLYARTFGHAVTWLTGAYLAIILIGSILLGWHYAIDGYAAILGTLLIWRFAGGVLRGITGRVESRRPCP